VKYINVNEKGRIETYCSAIFFASKGGNKIVEVNFSFFVFVCRWIEIYKKD
jgi:hypothetical protein